MNLNEINNKYLISVIVPVYCAEKYLAQCIESILNQTYQNFEVILVDDGSPDDSISVCEEYAEKDSRIHIIRQENKGVSAARNAGIDYCSGDYITFVDSDDELEPNGIEFLLNNAVLEDADISSAVKWHVLQNGEKACAYNDGKRYVYDGLDGINLSLDGERQTNSACAKLYKKSFIGETRFVEGKNINEDGFFLFECYVKQPKMVQHNECVYKYFIRDNSSSRKEFSEKYLDMLYFSDKKKEIVDEKFPFLKHKVLGMETSAHLFFLEALCRTSEKKYRKYEKASIKLVRKNYREYEPMYDHEKKFAKIVYWGLYPVYKLFIRVRNKIS